MFCHVPKENVLAVHDCKSVYHVPLLLRDQGLLSLLKKRLSLPDLQENALMTKWIQLTSRIERLHDSVRIVLVGKYTNLQDSYISVVKSLEHASLACSKKLILDWVESSDLEDSTLAESPGKFHDAWKKVCDASGIIVPGGFGTRGIQGMIAAARHARVSNIPYLGICLGMQVAVIEYARNVCGISNATSEEFDENKNGEHVVVFMPEINRNEMGATMRLGSRSTHFTNPGGSVVRDLYGGKEVVYERHRHRYEVNPALVPTLVSAGLEFPGVDESGDRMGVMCVGENTFHVGCQYHPEYKTRPLGPVPLFLGFIGAAAGMLKEVRQACRNGTELI